MTDEVFQGDEDPFFDHKPDKPARHEISPEDRDTHVKSLRDLVQMIHNRNDQDTNKVLDNMTKHLDALDGNPEEREAARLEAEQNRVQAEKRADEAKVA